MNQSDDLRVQASHSNGFISRIELVYLDVLNQFHRVPMDWKGGPDFIWAVSTSALTPSSLPDTLFYYFDFFSPLERRTKITGEHVVPLLSFDDGILLSSQLLGSQLIRWQWTGPTVDMADSFEIWSGDDLLMTTPKTFIDIPIDFCEPYQIISVRAHLPKNAPHPKAGEFSLFSSAGERFFAPNISLTHQVALDHMRACLPINPEDDLGLFSEFIPQFDPGAPLTNHDVLNWMLFWMYDYSPPQLRFEELKLLFMGIGFLTLDDFNSSAPRSSEALFYHLITRMRHESHFFEKTLRILHVIDLVRNGDPAL
ncbi:hypothetical protein IPJ72_01385 [Candidatus Peregrinibacteria bacterium]|nr:MAG: hypothetical protein IPJ72_01385 [Candidatus Peregrinibacteria bacterium]